jgi:hypothetical protein
VSEEETSSTAGGADPPNEVAVSEQLSETLYAELRRLANRELRRQPGAGVSPTTLVHEAYVNLAGRDEQLRAHP